MKVLSYEFFLCVNFHPIVIFKVCWETGHLVWSLMMWVRKIFLSLGKSSYWTRCLVSWAVHHGVSLHRGQSRSIILITKYVSAYNHLTLQELCVHCPTGVSVRYYTHRRVLIWRRAGVPLPVRSETSLAGTKAKEFPAFADSHYNFESGTWKGVIPVQWGLFQESPRSKGQEVSLRLR